MDIKFFETIPSTNTYLKDLVRNEGNPDEQAAVAYNQSAGRGRLGRTFYSPGTGLYLSVLLKPKGSAEDIVKITSAAGVIVAKNLGGKIKWVNDIIIDEKKVCGILCESVGEYVIVGIGINLVEPEGGFPEDIRNIAGAVYEKCDDLKRYKLAMKIVREVGKLSEPKYIKKAMKKYKKLSCVLNRIVTVSRGNEEYRALVLDINEDGHLIVEKEDGTKCILQTGEISIKNWK